MLRLRRLLGRRLTGLAQSQVAFIQHGNQVVFEAAHSRIFELLAEAPRTGSAALEWDRYILQCEQQRLQPLYEQLATAPKDLLQLEKRLKEPSYALRQLLPTLTAVPFRGRLLNLDDRMAFGLRMMYPEYNDVSGI